VLANIQAVSPELSTTSIFNRFHKKHEIGLVVEMCIDSSSLVTKNGLADYEMMKALGFVLRIGYSRGHCKGIS